MNIEQFLNKKYQFKLNVVNNRTYIKEKNTSSEFELLTDYKVNSIKRELNHNNISVTKSDLTSLLHSDFVSTFDPFIDYFTNLGEWDSQHDYIADLANTVQTTNQELFVWAFKKWLVAMVTCALEKDTTNQSILVLTGGQGIGKSTWLRNIIPPILQDYIYSGNINPSNKDSTVLMSDKLLINLDEMASLSKKNLDAFKEMVTKGVITERRAYAHFAEDYVRRASFVGSANHNEILMDLTGNRRFLCFEAIAIDFKHNINLDAVYRQVFALVRQEDFSCHFDLEDVKRLEENNKMFLQSSEEADYIDDLFNLPSEENSIFMTATDIALHIQKEKSIYQKPDVQQIGKIMKAKGFERKKNKGLWKYEVELNKG